MTASVLTQVARAARSVNAALGVLTDVELLRRSDTRSSVTGERGFKSPVAARAKITGMGLLEIGKDRSVQTGRFRVELFDQMVEAGDKIRWDGEEHLVLEVRGVLVAGGRFLTVAVAD